MGKAVNLLPVVCIKLGFSHFSLCTTPCVFSMTRELLFTKELVFKSLKIGKLFGLQEENIGKNKLMYLINSI